MRILLLLALVPLACLVLNCLGFIVVGLFVLWPFLGFLKAVVLYCEKEGLYSFGWCLKNA